MPVFPQSAPEVSVVVPAYNCESTLPRAIASALGQTLPPLEILVIDDGSTDGTAEVAEAFGPPVRLIRQTNAGAAAARNRGIAEARGEIVAFLDADDEWLPERLARGAAPFGDDPSVGLTWCHLYRAFPDGSREIYGRHFDRYLIFPGYFWPSALHQTSGAMVRRSAFDRVGVFDASLRSREDQDLWIRMREAFRTVEVAEALAVYHETAGSLSKTTDLERVRADYFRVLERGFARRPDLYEPHRRTILAEAFWHWGLKYLAGGRRAEARRSMLRSLASRPSLRALAALSLTFLPGAMVAKVKRRLRGRGAMRCG